MDITAVDRDSAIHGHAAVGAVAALAVCAAPGEAAFTAVSTDAAGCIDRTAEYRNIAFNARTACAAYGVIA